MKKTKSAKPQADHESSPQEATTEDGLVIISNLASQQDSIPAVAGVTSSSTDPATHSANESLNISTSNTSEVKSPPRRDPKKLSSNFTPVERIFILMAIAAVRTDPKWRKHEDPTDPETVKGFTKPFCQAVRQKLLEDPDFKGRVAMASAAPDQDGKYRRSPSEDSMRKIWTNLYLNGSLIRPQNNVGRKKDLAAEERVKQYLYMNPTCKMSSRAIAAQTQTSNANVIRILRQENLAFRRTKLKRIDEVSKKRTGKGSKKNTDKND